MQYLYYTLSRPQQPQHKSPLNLIPDRPISPLCFSSPIPGMEAAAGSTLYPLHRCKTLHLVRHAQGIHNVAGEKDFNVYLSEELFYAHLTPLGWQQVDNLCKHVQESGLSKRIELVIVSPLLRTMQTAVGVLGGGGRTDGIDSPPLMGVHPCDRRRSISEYRPLFPAVDFSLIQNDGDISWMTDVREKNEEVAGAPEDLNL